MRLQITRGTELAVRAILVLGDGERHKAVELADAVSASAGFLTKLLQPLVAAGWLRSLPGPTGGFELAVPLESVSVLDVIEALEGPTDDGRCVLEPRPCRSARRCVLHDPWQEARRSLCDSLVRTPVSTLRLGTALAGLPVTLQTASKENKS